MKTNQAWGWLAAGVLAAGLNASYHDGGLQLVHRIAHRVEHSSAAILALASGNADRFLSEAQLVTARNENASCRLGTTLTRVHTEIASANTGFDRFEVMSDRQQAQLERLEANRDRMEAQIRARVEARTAHLRVPEVALTQVVLRTPQVSACPRIRVNIPQSPRIKMPVAPVIHIESGSGPI